MKQTVNEPHQTTAPRSVWQAWILLALGLIATAIAAFYVETDVEADAKREFDFACDEIRLKINARLNAHAQILRSGAALFDASDKITREKWHIFTTRQKVEQQLPGIQGIGFSLLIPSEQLAQHIQEIHAQGFPEYTVKPEGRREIYTSIIWLEPFSGRNLRAFGYDMFSEPVRRAAMEMARDTDSAALSGKVILVQETDQNVQAGTLMYVPVYRKGMPTDTIEQRRAALYGWVYSPYRMNDLMRGILGGWDVQENKRIRLQIFDGGHLELLYDSQAGKESESGLLFSSVLPIDVAGRRWALRFMQTGEQESPVDFTKLWLVISGGSIISLLLFILILSLFNTRFKARKIAERLTVDLRESEEKYRIIFNNEFFAICIFDLETLKFLDVNDAYTKLYGYSREELVSEMTIHDITVEHQVSDSATKQAVREGTIFIPLRFHRKKDGTVFPLEIVGGPYTWKGRKVMFALAHDITDRKRTEAALQESEENFRAFFDTIEHLLFVLDNSGNIIRVNQTVIRRLGYTEEELIGKNVLMLHPEERRDESGRIVFEMLQGKRDYCPIPVMTKDGKYIPVETRVIRGRWNGKDALFGVTKDISDIKASEEKFSKIFYNNPSAMAITDLDNGRFADINDAFIRITGYERDEVIGKTASELRLFADASQRDAAIKIIMEQGYLRNYETDIRMKSGAIRYGSFSAETLKLQDRKLLLTMMDDITERKQAEESLRQRQLEINAIFDALPGFVFFKNARFQYVTVNRTFYEAVQTEPTEIPGKTDYDLFPRNLADKYRADDMEMFRTGEPIYSVEEAMIRGDEQLVVSTNKVPLKDESGKIIGLVGLGFDISERKQIEEKLRAASLYNRSLIEASLDPLVTINPDGKISDVNTATEFITGYLREHLIGTDFSDYFTEPEKAEAGYNQVFKTGSVRDYELHLRHKDGKITPVLYNASVYRDESGNIIGVFAAARDISVRKRMEEERLELERQLLNMKKFESLIRTTAGIAHNFNNILFAVTGNIEIAMDDIPPESSSRQILEEAFKAANRAAELTRKILAYSGSGFFTFKEIDINSMIQENTHLLKSVIPETVSFSLNLADHIPLISADPEQIQRLIMNILVNAFEALGENAGTVILSTGINDSYDDSLSNGLQRIDDSEEKPGAGQFVYIEISDTGCGMDEESIRLLFDPFFTTKFMGRGLGMSEVQGIVRTHKGVILLKSELGRGTTIRVLFPVLESVPKVTEQKLVHQEISRTDSLPKMILVVDDEETVRDVCDMMLEHLGYRRLMATDGDEAVEIFKEHTNDIHCVLLDLTMPKKDGISAFKEMRCIREDVRIIISSGHSKEEISRRFKDYGLVGVLQKPYSLKDLQHELEAVT
jgi:PAS domain S-box-containing protein